LLPGWYWVAPQNELLWGWFGRLSKPAQLTVGDSRNSGKTAVFARYPQTTLFYQFYMLFTVYKVENMPIDSIKVVVLTP
jgi:hypothetical protein